MLTENPYEPPTVVNVSVDPAQNQAMELAGHGERLAGAIIDGLINVAFSMLVAFGLIATGVLGSFVEYTKLGIVTTVILTLTGFAFYMGINWKFLSTSGQTIGKKVAKTRIVTMDGRVPSMVDLVAKRYAFFTLLGVVPVAGGILSIINILFIFGRERRCLHDLVAGTRVVKATPVA